MPLMKSLRRLAIMFLLIPGISQAAPLLVLSSAPPVDFLVRQIAGKLAKSEVLIKPGRNPENDEPSPQQMKTASKAVLWFRIGLPFEQRWEPVIRSANPHIREVSLNKLQMRVDADKPKQKSGLDPHIWTDPVQMLGAAKKVRDALVHNDPEHSDDYNQKAERLFDKLKKLDKDISALLSPWRDHAFLVYHPAWGHFAQRYGLRQIAMEQEGKTPGPRRLVKLTELAKKDHIHTVFVQKQFDRANAQTLANAINANIVELDPLSADYFRSMRAAASAIAKSFQ